MTTPKFLLTATGPEDVVDMLWADYNNVYNLVRKTPELIEMTFPGPALPDNVHEFVATYPELSFTTLEYLEGENAGKTVLSVLSERPAEDPVENAAPAKKQYDTPFIPRNLWFKQQREAGNLPPRQRKATEAPVEVAASAGTPAKRVRSEAQKKFLRGLYARKKAGLAA